MPLSIRNPSVESKARQLARQSGRSMTEVIEEALDARLKLELEASKRREARLARIAAHCAALPDLDLRSPDEILGYDEHGAFPHGD